MSGVARHPSISAPVSLLFSTYTGATTPIISPAGSPSLSDVSDSSDTDVSSSASSERTLSPKFNEHFSFSSGMSVYPEGLPDIMEEDNMSYVESVLDLGLGKYSAEDYEAIIAEEVGSRL